MCIIQGESGDIANTNIFVGEVGNSRQITIYSNMVTDAAGSPTMILPYPKGDISLVSPKEDFFQPFANHFPISPTLAFGEVGNYDVAIVPQLSDLVTPGYLDDFSLDPQVASFLGKYYKDTFGFLVCKIKNGMAYHPLGFVHNMLVHNGEERLFVPTRHYHNGSEFNADWDHCVFLYTKKQINNIIVYETPIFKSPTTLSDPNKDDSVDFYILKNPNLDFGSLGLLNDMDLYLYKIGKNYKFNHDILVAA